MKKDTKYIVLLILSGWICMGARASIIYQDDFSGSAATVLNGAALDVTVGTNKWISAGSQPWYADGHIDAQATAWTRTAYVAFTPEAGKIYTLSMDMNPAGSGSEWVGLGFLGDAATVSSSFTDAAAAAGPWVLMQSDRVKAGTYAGAAVANGINKYNVDFPGDWAGLVNMKIILDTTGSNWTAEWFVDSTSVRTYTYTDGNPLISKVGFSRQAGTLGATVDNFELSVIPEPVTLGLLSSGAVVLLLARRGIKIKG